MCGFFHLIGGSLCGFYHQRHRYSFFLCTLNFLSPLYILVVLCKCLRQLVTRGNDQLESLISFGHCAHFTLKISDWSCRVGNLIQPIRRTTQIWVVTRHQYGISALVSQTSFGGETSGSVAKCRLFSQAPLFVICMKNEFRSKRGKTVLLLSTISSVVTSAELHLVQFVECWQFFSRVEL